MILDFLTLCNILVITINYNLHFGYLFIRHSHYHFLPMLHTGVTCTNNFWNFYLKLLFFHHPLFLSNAFPPPITPEASIASWIIPVPTSSNTHVRKGWYSKNKTILPFKTSCIEDLENKRKVRKLNLGYQKELDAKRNHCLQLEGDL